MTWELDILDAASNVVFSVSGILSGAGPAHLLAAGYFDGDALNPGYAAYVNLNTPSTSYPYTIDVSINELSLTSGTPEPSTFLTAVPVLGWFLVRRRKRTLVN